MEMEKKLQFQRLIASQFMKNYIQTLNPRSEFWLSISAKIFDWTMIST